MSSAQIIRRVVQVIAFLLFPGLFYTVYTALKSIVMALIAGNFSPMLYLSDIAILVAVIPITILFGRFFCSFICAFGAMCDFLYFLPGIFLKRRPQIPPRLHSILRWLKYLVLVAIIVFIWILGYELPHKYDPWHVFGVYTDISAYADLSTLLSVGGAILAAIMLISLVFKRFFCRYLCPLGAFFEIISFFRLFRIKRKEEKCNHCGLCDRDCAMGVRVSEKQRVNSGECIDCLECIDVCNQDAIVANARPAVAGALAAVTITGLYYVGAALSEEFQKQAIESQTTQQAEEAAAAAETSGAKYADGTYTGTASGYRGMTTVQVTVEGGIIKSVDIVSSGDDFQYLNKVEPIVIPSIIRTQSTDVATVSGATFTSRAIINAVANALGTMSTEESTAKQGGESKSGPAEGGGAQGGGQGKGQGQGLGKGNGGGQGKGKGKQLL